ncbi:hypothetical protein BpHYR1_025803, partial [Brachionus plicatilis]
KIISKNYKQFRIQQSGHIHKLKYDTPSNIVHHEAFNKLKLLTVSNRLFELSERYVGTGLSHSIPLVERLVKEYKEGFESRHIEYPTPLSESNEETLQDADNLEEAQPKKTREGQKLRKEHDEHNNKESFSGVDVQD